jgi:acetyl-CoA synthetase
LFTAFGPQGVEYRLQAGEASVIVTDEANRPKLKDIPRDAVPGLKTVTVTRDDSSLEPEDFSFWTQLEGARPVSEPVRVSGDDPIILIFTSGTTGNPKGVPVPVKALAAFEAYMRFGLDVRDEDVYWNMADPGWAYGLYYNLIGPLLLGKPILFYGGAFTPQEAYRVMHDWKVTNFASAPTAYRALMAAGDEPLQEYRPSLRVASSAGEPLNPEVINWALSRFGVPIHDHYGQTELGMIINNHHLPEIRNELKPGSMGLAMPGFRAVVVDENGRELGPGQEGQLAIDTQASPLNWFSGYWKDEAKTIERYTADGRYCLTGDTISTDADGYFFFSGRSDDIILSAGYRIGPFEVESVLMQHPDVTETAVIGVPDQLRGEVVKAYVVLQQGKSGSQDLAEELKTMVKEKLSKHEYPREIEFVTELPKTPSGKIQRFLLRQST